MFNIRYAKDKGDGYFKLLKLCTIEKHIDDLTLSKDDLNGTLDLLPQMESSLKRLIPLINCKSIELDLFKDLHSQTQSILNEGTLKGIVTELAKKKQLNFIVDILSEFQIPIILLKGAAFTNTIYSKDAPRTSNDLDILVREEHWEHVCDLLRLAMKYQAKEQPDVFGDLYEISFVPKIKVGASVDLHKGLIHPKLFKIDYTELWNESLIYEGLNNKLVRVLSPEHTLIHQALHAYKDMDFAKYNMVDTHHILANVCINEDVLLKASKKYKATIPLYIILYNCKYIIGSKIDDKLLNILRPNKFQRYLCQYLLKSNYSQPLDGKKSYKYRVNQTISVFLFTSSFFNSLSFFCLYISSYIKGK